MKATNRLLRYVWLAAAWCVVSAAGATAPKGVFSVGTGAYVTIDDANYAQDTKTFFDYTEMQAIRVSGKHVLTAAEWTYLLVTRDTCRAAADQRNGLGTVNGTHGLIIIPDFWTQPSTAPAFCAGTSNGWSTNTYTASEWSQMSAAGAAFLPAAGASDGSSVTNAGTYGVYWSATVKDEDEGYAIMFENSVIHDRQEKYKTTYYSVRLAQTVNVLDEDDEKSAYDTKFASAKSESFAYVQRTLYKDGYFNTLCLPFDVTSIEDSPLAGAEVYAFQRGSVEDDVLYLEITEVSSIAKGVPYLIRWESGSDLSFLPFTGVTWDDDDAAGSDPGSTDVKYHGFYYKTHLDDVTDGGSTHYNFFLGEANELYWPNDGGVEGAKMKGFRAHFYIVTGTTPTGGPSHAPAKGMRAVLRIKRAPTGVEEVKGNGLQVTGTKVLRDGQLVLIVNGETYSIGGQRQ